MEEGNIADCFVQGLGLALAANTCPHRRQAFKTVNNGQAFPQEENIFFIFSEKTGPRYPKARQQSFRGNIRRSDCLGPISSHASPIFDPTLKLSCRATTQITSDTCFSHNGQMFTPFFEILIFLHTRVVSLC